MLTKISVYLLKHVKISSSKFIPHEIILCDDRDPLCISSKIKKLVNEKNAALQFYVQNCKNDQSFQITVLLRFL